MGTDEERDVATTRLGDYEMTEEDCWRKLREHHGHVGRLAFVAEGMPVVLPVNYRVDNRSIVIRSGPGSKLAAATAGQVLAFEADEVNPDWQVGWSVLIRGRAQVVEARDEIRALERLGLRPWARGDLDHWLRLRAIRISGRELT